MEFSGMLAVWTLLLLANAMHEHLPLIVPLGLGAALALAYMKVLNAQTPPLQARWEVAAPQWTGGFTLTPPTEDVLTGNDRIGAQHLAARYGTGCMYHSKELVSYLSLL